MIVNRAIVLAAIGSVALLPGCAFNKSSKSNDDVSYVDYVDINGCHMVGISVKKTETVRWKGACSDSRRANGIGYIERYAGGNKVGEVLIVMLDGVQTTQFLSTADNGCAVYNSSYYRESRQGPVARGITADWMGGCQDGLASGAGRLRITVDGLLRVQEDGMFLGGKLNGSGRRETYDPNGRLTLFDEGEFVKGLLQGVGQRTSYNDKVIDVVHKGDFEGGRLHGKAESKWASPCSDCIKSYVGEYRANKMSGYGEAKYANGDQYEGAWEADKPVGLTKFSREKKEWEERRLAAEHEKLRKRIAECGNAERAKSPGNRPSADDVSFFLGKAIAAYGKSRVCSTRIIDGASRNVRGSYGYVIEFESSIVSESGIDSLSNFAAFGLGSYKGMMCAAGFKGKSGWLRAGEFGVYKCAATFIKKDNGWDLAEWGE